MKELNALHGLMAQFTTHEQLIEAARRAHEQGYRRMDAYTPFPVEGLAETLGRKRTSVPLIVLVGGICGGLGGYFVQWYSMAADYPVNVGGRPFNSWPAYIPITFEMTVLAAALAAIVGMLVLNRLPQPYHPVFNAPGFDRASIDRFFLCIEASDPKFAPLATRQFLEALQPESVAEVRK
jgi:hypothetical protein